MRVEYHGGSGGYQIAVVASGKSLLATYTGKGKAHVSNLAWRAGVRSGHDDQGGHGKVSGGRPLASCKMGLIFGTARHIL